VILKTIERRAKLLGLEAPQKIAQTTPEGNALPTALDLSKLTDAELAEMKRLYEKAGAVATAGSDY
jgi:type II secretory pathway component PulF